MEEPDIQITGHRRALSKTLWNYKKFFLSKHLKNEVQCQLEMLSLKSFLRNSFKASLDQKMFMNVQLLEIVERIAISIRSLHLLQFTFQSNFLANFPIISSLKSKPFICRFAIQDVCILQENPS